MATYYGLLVDVDEDAIIVGESDEVHESDPPDPEDIKSGILLNGDV
jgi:hypothetical protein